MSTAEGRGHNAVVESQGAYLGSRRSRTKQPGGAWQVDEQGDQENQAGGDDGRRPQGAAGSAP